ncbi:MAG: VOC family protein [Rhodocyclales bacterium]|nr:VOC family protein [Rhodocyclales bacterium]
MRSPVAVPDHLVLAARDLDAGAIWLEGHLGVALSPGGKHQRMGTHNRLLGLGEGFYLELIAIDPLAPPPGRPRWFGLDDAKWADDRPRLIHWVARSDDILRDAAASIAPLGAILPMERGDYRWRITVPPDGHLPGDGLLPTLIQWDVPFHPAQRLPESGCRLMKQEAFHPDPVPLRRALAVLGLDSRLDLHRADGGEPAPLVAYLKTPRGLVELD